jgi:hypothetical protein
MIDQHPALDTARQRRAEAVATLLMGAASRFVLFVRDVQRRLLPRRRDDPAAHGISLPARGDEAEAES